jgi:hypothetical protein
MVMQQIPNIIQLIGGFVKPFLHTFSSGTQGFGIFCILVEFHDPIPTFLGTTPMLGTSFPSIFLKLLLFAV